MHDSLPISRSVTLSLSVGALPQTINTRFLIFIRINCVRSDLQIEIQSGKFVPSFLGSQPSSNGYKQFDDKCSGP